MMTRDPFEAAMEAELLDSSPPDSPAAPPDEEPTGDEGVVPCGHSPFSTPATVSGIPSGAEGPSAAAASSGGVGKGKGEDEEEDDEDEDNVDVDLSRVPSGDPDKMAQMNAILAQFTKEQMTRYESFRRSNFQRSNMRRLLINVTGSQKISLPITIVVCGIAKMFVGELVETGRTVMSERKEGGPLRPFHIREAYRRLKLEGKVPKRSVPRLFH